MNRIKKGLFFILFLGMNTFNSFAHLGGRGRINSGGLSDFATILMLIAGIVVGGFLGFTLLGGSSTDGFKDKEMTKTGCVGILIMIGSLVLLVTMCSH